MKIRSVSLIPQSGESSLPKSSHTQNKRDVLSCAFTGRRSGVSLYSGMVPDRTPVLAPRSLLVELSSILHPLELVNLFPEPKPLEVELGSGDGSFLVEYARLHPERNFLGVERLLGRLVKIDRKGRRAGLTNLRGVRIESSYFLKYLLPPASVAALHIYFPDPWPKRKHRRHRLINPEFPQLARQALVPGGAVFLRTDDADYFAQMREVFGASPHFAPAEAPAELTGVVTDFEREFQNRGIGALRATYRLEAPVEAYSEISEEKSSSEPLPSTGGGSGEG